MKSTFELMVDFQRVQAQQVVINVRQVWVAAAVENRSPNGRRKLGLLLDYLRGQSGCRPCNTINVIKTWTTNNSAKFVWVLGLPVLWRFCSLAHHQH